MFAVVRVTVTILEPYPVGIFGRIGGFGWITLQYKQPIPIDAKH